MNKHNWLDEGELLAYAEGEGTTVVRERITAVPTLQAMASQLLSDEQLLAAAWQRQDCPESDQLLQYQYGLLAQADLDDIAQHLPSCTACQTEVAELIQGITEEEPQPSWLDQMKAAGKRIVGAIPRVPSARPAFELRGVAQSRLVFDADNYQIVLVIAKSGESCNIEGQIIDQADPLNDLGGTATLLNAGEPQASSLIEPFGFFNFTSIHPDQYELSLELSSNQLLLLTMQVSN